MATLNEDVGCLPAHLHHKAKALWSGDHQSPEGFLENGLRNQINGVTIELMDRTIMGWLTFFRTVDEKTGKRRHEVLYPNLTWEDMLRHIGFNDASVDVWVRAIRLNPDVSAVDVHKRLLAEKRAAEPAAREGPGKPEGSRGGNQHSEPFANCGNTAISERKDRGDLKRLKRDLPDVAARVVSGEISLNKAAIDAGFRKKKVQVEVSAEGFAKAIEKHLDEDQLAAFREWLTEYVERGST